MMPFTELKNIGGAKIREESKKEKELSFVQVRLNFLWDISELSSRLLISVFAVLLLMGCVSLYIIFILTTYHMYDS